MPQTSIGDHVCDNDGCTWTRLVSRIGESDCVDLSLLGKGAGSKGVVADSLGVIPWDPLLLIHVGLFST